MTNAEDKTVSDVVAERIREIRRQRGLKAPELAAKAGLSAQVIFNIENRRRRVVTVDELLALARGLDVPAVELLLPTEDESARLEWLRADIRRLLQGLSGRPDLMLASLASLGLRPIDQEGAGSDG